MKTDDFEEEPSPRNNSQRATEFFLLLAVVIIPLCMWAISQGIPGIVGEYAFGLLPQAVGLFSMAVQAALLPLLMWIGLRQPIFGGRVLTAILALGFVLLVEPAFVTLIAIINWGLITNPFSDSAFLIEVAFDDVVGSCMIVIGLFLIRSFTRFRVCHRLDVQEPVLCAPSISRLLIWTTLLAILFAFLRLPWERFNLVSGADVRPGFELIAPTTLYLSATLIWLAPLIIYIVLRAKRRLWHLIGYAAAYWLMQFVFLRILYFCYPVFQLGTSFAGMLAETAPQAAAFCLGLLAGIIVFERLGFRVVRCQIRAEVG